jgi:hypothetical protein
MISILCNNIAGLDNKYGKMLRVVQVINERNIDVFMGQELNQRTRTQQFRTTVKCLHNNKQHIVTAKIKWAFISEKKPGEIFCISNVKMWHLNLRKPIDHMGRWAGNVYQL